MRTGDSTPINIKLADGQVLRFSCTALPDGGRMLSYTPVTELVRHTDDPGQRRILPLAARRRPRADALSARGGVIIALRHPEVLAVLHGEPRRMATGADAAILRDAAHARGSSG